MTLIYEVSDDEGRILDQRLSDEPMTVVLGDGQLLPEIEALIEGLQPGERARVRLPPRPDDAGVGRGRRGHLKVPRQLLPPGLVPRVGAAILAEGEQGQVAMWIREVRSDAIVLDPRHPLSGLALNVSLEVVEVAH